MQVCKKVWRESASLLILGRNINRKIDDFNYKILVMQRSNKSSHLPSLNVFPGGSLEPADESKDWLDFYKSFGIPNCKFDELINVKGPRTFIFQRNDEHSIAREISLRICAIRETFEEVGVLICKTSDEFQKNTISSKIVERLDVKHWQKEILNDPTKFLYLCRSLNIAPDLWSLYEWSAWLAPAFFQNRFDTAFFLVALDDQPSITQNNVEVQTSAWCSPIQLLEQFKSNEIILTAPQIYELNRLTNIKDIDILATFAKARNNKGLPLMFGVNYTTKDKNVSTFPGDDFYPKNPDYWCDTKTAKISMKDLTAQEFRSRAKHLHRLEYKGNDWKIISNIKQDNDHLSPVDYLQSQIQSKM